MPGRCVLSMNQVLRTRDKVVENILLAGQLARAMPLFTVFASTSQVRHHEDAPLVEPDARESTEEFWRHTDAIAAITLHQHRVCSVQLRTFFAHDAERNLCAILGD